MGSKRKVLGDPNAAKRRRVEEREAALIGDKGVALAPKKDPLDLWNEIEVKKPSNKEHGGYKGERVKKMDAMRKVTRLPHSSQSYNPDPKLHEAAVKAAEAKLLRKEKVLADQALRARVDWSLKKRIVGDDMKGTDWQEVVAGEERDDLGKANKRKTRVTRNKAARLALAIKLKKRVQQRKNVVRDADRIDEIRTEIATDKATTAAKQKVRKDLEKNRTSLRVGRRRYRESALDLQTADDIKPSMRSQGTVTASMKDPLKLQFESFQAKSIVPATSRKKVQIKRPVKYSLRTEWNKA